MIPPLPAECAEIDGDLTTMPIVFEDIYTDHHCDEMQPGESQEHASLLYNREVVILNIQGELF